MILRGVAVALDVPPDLRPQVEALLAHFGATAGGPADDAVRFAVGGRPPAPGPGARRTATHLDLEVLRDADGLVVRGPASATRISADGRSSRTALVGPDLPGHVVAYVVLNQLRALGHHVLHAACVARGGLGCVLVGASGAGKSTLALGLLRAGWDLLSDDSVLVTAAPEGVRIGALRRGLFLARPATAPFPYAPDRWRAHPLLGETKLELPVAEHFPGRQREACAPALLGFPSVDPAVDVLEVEPVTPSEALYGLVVESRLSELDGEGHAAQFALLARLAAVPAVRLRMGPGLRGRFEVAADALARRLGGAA